MGEIDSLPDRTKNQTVSLLDALKIVNFSVNKTLNYLSSNWLT